MHLSFPFFAFCVVLFIGQLVMGCINMVLGVGFGSAGVDYLTNMKDI